MTEIIRRCPDCGHDRSLVQLHRLAGRSPDAAGSDCPEWYCLRCGAALLIGDVPAVNRSAVVRDRVA